MVSIRTCSRTDRAAVADGSGAITSPALPVMADRSAHAAEIVPAAAAASSAIPRALCDPQPKAGPRPRWTRSGPFVHGPWSQPVRYGTAPDARRGAPRAGAQRQMLDPLIASAGFAVNMMSCSAWAGRIAARSLRRGRSERSRQGGRRAGWRSAGSVLQSAGTAAIWTSGIALSHGGRRALTECHASVLAPAPWGGVAQLVRAAES